MKRNKLARQEFEKITNKVNFIVEKLTDGMSK